MIRLVLAQLAPNATAPVAPHDDYYYPPAESSGAPWGLIAIIALLLVGAAMWYLQRSGIASRIPMIEKLQRVIPAASPTITKGPDAGAPRPSPRPIEVRDGFPMDQILDRYDAHPSILADHIQDFLDVERDGLGRLRAALADRVFESDLAGGPRERDDIGYEKIYLAALTESDLAAIDPVLRETLGFPAPDAPLVAVASGRRAYKNPPLASWRPDEEGKGPERRKKSPKSADAVRTVDVADGSNGHKGESA